ncbi:hypothetical protein GYA49_04015 [Candidatus Beckwithbacteria bacterium]|nr:hypothetical protein [Candidatus Beckwithbacteria bacterium]
MVVSTFLIYTFVTVAELGILFLLFYRRHKRQEQQLDQFLKEAREKLQVHKEEAQSQANKKVVKAFELIKRLQHVASELEGQVQEEYEAILEEAKEQKKQILEEAKTQASSFDQAISQDLEEYKQERFAEVEKNLVKLVISVTEKVVERSLSYEDHIGLIQEALEEVKKQKQRI